ncbi:MAG TPA: DUF3307 domain-containing protein [Aggregatilineales bacterium]|nr:DUF3307 domain-containing protein [Aggregatilineales bacterium]
MLIPHLLFAHFLADYTLQTNWLIVRKGQSWDGLALHALMVFFMSALVLAPYIRVLFLPLVAMSVVHGFQDWGKIYTGPRFRIHPFIPYMLDQFLHYITIIIMQVLFGSLLQPAPSQAELLFMSAGAVSIAVTRFYDVTWWANWLDMIPYMNRWQVWGYAERLAMVTLAAAGLAVAAPLCVLPRLVYSARIGLPIWKQARGALELVIGVIFSIGLGLVLRGILLGIH